MNGLLWEIPPACAEFTRRMLIYASFLSSGSATLSQRRGGTIKINIYSTGMSRQVNILRALHLELACPLGYFA